MIASLSFTVAGFEIPVLAVLLGAIIGLLYGLLAVGLVLVYRSSRLINFAHGQVGAFAAAVFAVASERWHVPYWIAFFPALAIGGATGVIAEVAVVRRLRNAPPAMSIVATLGFGQFLLLLAFAVNSSISGFSFPEPSGLPEFDLGELRITRAYSGMLLLAPLTVVALTTFLRRSRVGNAVRAAAANPEAAEMAGIPARRMSSLSWGLSGVLSALTALLVAPTQGIISGDSFGPSLLLRALAAGVIAKMESLPRALAAGMGLGVVEGLLLWNYPRGGLTEVMLFGVIVVALLAQKSVGGRGENSGSWAAVQAWRPLPAAVRRHPSVRRASVAVGGLALGIAACLPLWLSNASAITMVGIFCFAIVGLSVGIVTGLSGELSFGQFAIASIGAVASYHVAVRTGSYALSLAYAASAAGLVAFVLGLPALRARGLMLTVTTLSFALVVPAWLLQQPWMLGAGVAPGRPILSGNALDSGREYYYFALGVLLVCVIAAWNIRRSGFGRVLMAVRDNDEGARAFTIAARRVKMQGIVLAGGIAGIGGAVYGHMLSQVGPTAFPVRSSVDVVVMTVLGGLGSLVGPLIGVLYYIGFPAFVPLDAAGLAGTQLMGLLLILYLPGGLVQALEPLRTRAVRRLVGSADVATDQVPPEPVEHFHRPPTSQSVHRTGNGHRNPVGLPVLEAAGLSKAFGGVQAIYDVSIEVCDGETLALIGPNGAGKTTLFEILGGFTIPDAGVVRYLGEDVTYQPPEDRAAAGLVRSFQDAALFPTMTVLDAVVLSLEHQHPTRVWSAVAGRTTAERQRRAHADELIGAMGLGSYRDRRIRELSTGTRRITELACILALQPRVLLLDEPSSGIAQRETEGLGVLLADLKRDLGLTMVIIEHDIPLVMGLSDRVVAMEAGRVIACGSPDQVQRDPGVVEAYLGGRIEAINRSNARPDPAVLETCVTPRSRRAAPLRAAP